MTDHALIAPAPIRKSFTVAAPPERAFAVFVAMGGWWQRSHSIAPSGQATVTVEPFAGGRWYETGTGGEECTWGEVLAYEPPRRLMLTWGLSATWTYDPDLKTEIEVRFTPEGTGTRVDFEHRKLDAFGARAAEMAVVLDSPGGWTGLMAAYAAAAGA